MNISEVWYGTVSFNDWLVSYGAVQHLFRLTSSVGFEITAKLICACTYGKPTYLHHFYGTVVIFHRLTNY